MPLLDFLTSIFTFAGDDNDINSCAGDVDICAAVQACAGNNPCEAAWQATYTYQADRAYDMAKIQALLGLAFGYLQYQSADRTADRQYDIANRQMCIAEEEYARYKCVYVECEDSLAAEVCAETLPEVDYDVYADRALRDVRKTFTIAREKLSRKRSRYCISDALKNDCQMEKAEALAVIAARESAYRYAEKRRDYLEERRFERRKVIFQHGRNIMTGQSTVYQTGLGLATQALGAAGQARNDLYAGLGGIAQGLLGSYYQTVNPFPYGSGYTGSGATTTGGSTGAFTNGSASGFSPSGVPN